MNVYIVTSGEYADYQIRSVHTTRSAAQEVADKISKAAMFETDHARVETWCGVPDHAGQTVTLGAPPAAPAVCGASNHSRLDPMTCGRYVDANGKHQGWHTGFNPETGQTGTWTPVD